MLFEVSEEVEHPGQDKFVEENNSEESQHCDCQSLRFQSILLRIMMNYFGVSFVSLTILVLFMEHLFY